MLVDSGYWRSSAESDNIIQCLFEDACLGGMVENAEGAPVECAEGYMGTLCHECSPNDYSRSGSN